MFSRSLVRISLMCVLPISLPFCVVVHAADDSPGETEKGSPAARADQQYNLDKAGLAIQGYDPVSYFKEGGGEPQLGRPEIAITLGKATYRFATEAHKTLFEKNPGKYEPAYGGWCAYAMGAKGEKVEINPKAFTITSGRLCLFYKTVITDTRKPWNKDLDTLKPSADAAWEKLTGEKPPVEDKEKKP